MHLFLFADVLNDMINCKKNYERLLYCMPQLIKDFQIIYDDAFLRIGTQESKKNYETLLHCMPQLIKDFQLFYDNTFLRSGAQEVTNNHALKLMLGCLENRTDCRATAVDLCQSKSNWFYSVTSRFAYHNFSTAEGIAHPAPAPAPAPAPPHQQNSSW